MTIKRECTAILTLLLILAVLSWIVLWWQSSHMMNGMNAGLTMGMSAIVFLSVWTVMMIAMMFPTAAPMILMFAHVHAGRRRAGNAFVPTWVFIAAYLFLWVLFGAIAYVGAVWLQELARQVVWLRANAARIGGAVLILAGLYQLSPFKQVCLSKCRTPLDFILSSWRDGYSGSFSMGLEHGLYCLGCCWLLFVILFPLGMMNITAIAGITLLIIAERSFPIGRQIAHGAAIVLIVYGILVMFLPGLLPAMTGTM